ncbi:hypothetical protein GCM10011369_32500 [Neiella marina]|uniref:DUF748 domain-containing protein n=1 Tax=Neiella marina TaxID=508461 RepID=A0A8J2XR71_9GAMM|nr:DUF748 domain-containing protein [Neiella marina]GGA87914.1 hypothetical protein GCM10011369_32500 [Neiella marina]
MNRLKKVGLIIAGCYLAIWSLTWLVSPAVTRLVLSDLLKPHKIELDSNSEVRLNLLSSCVTIDDLIWRKDQQLAFELDELEACYSLHRLVFSEARVKRLTLTGLTTDVLLKDGTFSIAGVELGASAKQAQDNESVDSQTPPTAPEPGPQGRRFALAVAAPEVILNDIKVNLQHRDQAHDVHIEQLQIVRSRYEEEVLQSELDVLLTLNQAKFEFGAAVVYEPLQSTGTFTIQLADFDPAPYQYLLPASVGQLSGLLDVDLNLDVTRKGDIFEITSDSSALALRQAGYSDSNIKAGLEGLQLQLNDLSTTLSIDAATELQVDTSFDLNLSGIKADLPDGSGELLALSELELQQNKLALVGEKVFVEIPELALTKFQASTRHIDPQNQLAPLLQLESLTVSGTQLTESAVAIQQVLVGEILVQASRDEQGELISLVLPQQAEATTPDDGAPQSGSAESEPVVAEVGQAFAFELGKLMLAAPAQIQFNDASVKPALAKTIIIEQLDVTEVNNAQPQQKTDVQLKLKDEGYFNYQLSAQVAPFADKLDLVFDSKATEFPLYQISPYVRSALGFDMLAGQLDVAAAGAIEQNMLDTELVAMLRGAQFDSGSGDANQDESSSIGSAVSLDMALGMLQDDDGNIELTIPVTGDIAAPDFGMQYVFGLVVQRAIMSQAENFLLFAFAPYAHVIKVGMVAGSMALEVSFEDLPYAPQQIQPAEPQASFIDQFHALMTEKQSLQVKICGVAAGSELGLTDASELSEAQRKQLLELAEQRAAAFKKVVVEKGVESSRLLLCVPSYELKADAKPRLKLSV